MEKDWKKKWKQFNLIVGVSGIVVLLSIEVLMQITRNFKNLTFLYFLFFLYIVLLNLTYCLIVLLGESIIKRFNQKVNVYKLFLYFCVLLNILLGIYFVWESSLYLKPHTSMR